MPKPVKDAALHVNPEKDEVTILGERVVYKEFIYLMLNKPQGVISATEDDRDRTVIDLLRRGTPSFRTVSGRKAR